MAEVKGKKAQGELHGLGPFRTAADASKAERSAARNREWTEENAMEKTDIERLRRKLELQRREIRAFLGQLEQETRSLNADSTQDMADQCVITLTKESLFERSSHRRTLLRLTDAALRRISDGSFGTCLGCGNDIQLRRLEALPWTQFCLRCQEAIEEEVGASLSAHVSGHSGTALRRTG